MRCAQGERDAERLLRSRASNASFALTRAPRDSPQGSAAEVGRVRVRGRASRGATPDLHSTRQIRPESSRINCSPYFVSFDGADAGDRRELIERCHATV